MVRKVTVAVFAEKTSSGSNLREHSLLNHPFVGVFIDGLDNDPAICIPLPRDPNRKPQAEKEIADFLNDALNGGNLDHKPCQIDFLEDYKIVIIKGKTRLFMKNHDFNFESLLSKLEINHLRL